MRVKGLAAQEVEVGLPSGEINTTPKLLQWARDKWGERVFMRHKDLGLWQAWTFNEVYEEVKYFSLGLMSLGLKRGEVVSIIGENEPENFWAHWAIMAAGGKAVCLYPDVTPPEALYMWDDSDTVYIICEDQEQVDKAIEVEDKLPGLRKIIYWDPRGMWDYTDPLLMSFLEVQELGRSYEADHPNAFEESIAQGKLDDIPIISYSSGTTGAHPKGILMNYANVLDSAHRVIKATKMRPFLQYLSYIAPAWATEQLFGLTMGLMCPYVLNFPEEPETVLPNIREIGAEMVVFSPRQWESLSSMVQARMLDANWIQRSMYKGGMSVGRKVAEGHLSGKPANIGWRILYHAFFYPLVLRPLRDKLGLLKAYLPICGGAAMAPDLFYLFQAMGVKLRNMYGLTEIGLLTVHQGEQYQLETVGQFMEVNPDLALPLEWKTDKDTGELLIRGGTPFLGYHKRPEASAEKIKDGWFSTEDCMAMTEGGEMVYLERLGDMRKLSTGVRFPPQFFETRLRFSPFIKDVMTLGDETKPFVAALINIDPETIGRWVEKRGIVYSTFPDLSQKPQVLELIRGEIEKVNKILPSDSQVKRFANLPKEFDPDEAELTRTRKLRRSFLEDRFGGLIEAIYQQEAEYITEVPVKYRDGRVGKVTTATKIIDLEAPAEVGR